VRKDLLVMEQPLVLSHLILSTMPLSSYQINYPTLQFGCYGTDFYTWTIMCDSFFNLYALALDFITFHACSSSSSSSSLNMGHSQLASMAAITWSRCSSLNHVITAAMTSSVLGEMSMTCGSSLMHLLSLTEITEDEFNCLCCSRMWSQRLQNTCPSIHHVCSTLHVRHQSSGHGHTGID